MKIDIKVPVMGESISEATVGQILKPVGSLVSQDEEILELETDKVNQVLYAPKSGKLELTVNVGDKVKIGQVIGSIEEGAAKIEAPLKANPAPILQPQEGVAARLTKDDFVRELNSPPPAPPKEEKKVEMASLPPSLPSLKRKKMSALRKTIATRLVEVKNKTAMLTTFNEVDMSKVMEIRAKEKQAFQEKYGVKLGFMSFFTKAVVSALKAFPEVHAFIEGEDIVYFDHFDIGIAVSTDKGLMVPVLRKCESLSFGEIEKSLENFAQKARSNTLSLDDLRGGSFTITNGGVFGSLLSTPILNPPQSAILGMHAIVKRPVAIEDQVVIRPMMYLALSYDHRVIDGKEAVQFLVHIKENLEDPSKLLLDL